MLLFSAAGAWVRLDEPKATPSPFLIASRGTDFVVRWLARGAFMRHRLENSSIISRSVSENKREKKGKGAKDES